MTPLELRNEQTRIRVRFAARTTFIHAHAPRMLESMVAGREAGLVPTSDRDDPTTWAARVVWWERAARIAVMAAGAMFDMLPDEAD